MTTQTGCTGWDCEPLPDVPAQTDAPLTVETAGERCGIIAVLAACHVGGDAEDDGAAGGDVFYVFS